MPAFRPFQGLRYSPQRVPSLDEVVCPPYDVISEEERAELEARSPLNIVRLELPAGEDRYRRAAALLEEWRREGILSRDPAPAFYGYRMSYSGPAGEPRQTLGVIGALGLEAPGSAILPHEQTTPKAKTDRLELLRATRANLSPIWGLCAGSGLSGLLTSLEGHRYQATDGDGVLHELWAITDPDQAAAIAGSVEAAPVLIADGHHRYETALAYRDEQSGGSDGDFVMALVVELAEEQLTVQAVHRLIAGLPSGFDLLRAFEPWCELVVTAPTDPGIGNRMARAGAMAVLAGGGTWLARPRPELTAKAAHDLDSSRLDVVLAELPPHQLTYQHGWQKCAAAVAAGEAQAAVLLRPPAIAQIQAIAHGGARMPPKTTFFWPKPRTGMVVRELLG